MSNPRTRDDSLEPQPIRGVGQARCASIVALPDGSLRACSVRRGHETHNTPHTSWNGTPLTPPDRRRPLATWSGDFYINHEREGS